MTKGTIQGKRVVLRHLEPKDVTKEYVSWLNDPEVNQFLETRFVKSTVSTQQKFVESFDNKRRFLWGIFDKKTDKHIGSITLYEIHQVHKHADYGYLIGDKEYWGTGAVQEAIALVFDFAFLKMGIHSISTGGYAPNVSSIFNYKKMGLRSEGIRREYLLLEGKFVDNVLYGITKDEWIAHRKKATY